MLQVDNPHNPISTDDRTRQKSFKLIFRKILEYFEAWIVHSLGGNGHRLTMFGYPSGDALPQPNSQMVHKVGMRIL